MKQAFMILLFLVATPSLAAHKHHHPRSPIAMTTTDVSSKINYFAEHMAKAHSFNQQEIHDFLISTEPVKDIFKFFGRRPKKNYTPEELEELKLLAQLRIQH